MRRILYFLAWDQWEKMKWNECNRTILEGVLVQNLSFSMRCKQFWLCFLVNLYSNKSFWIKNEIVYQRIVKVFEIPSRFIEIRLQQDTDSIVFLRNFRQLPLLSAYVRDFVFPRFSHMPILRANKIREWVKFETSKRGIWYAISTILRTATFLEK